MLLKWVFVSDDGDGYVGDGDKEDTFNPTMNAQAGVFEQLPAGMSFESFDPTTSNISI